MNMINDFLKDIASKYSSILPSGVGVKPAQNVIDPNSDYYKALLAKSEKIPSEEHLIEELTPEETGSNGSVLINRNIIGGYINRPTSIRKHPVTRNLWISSYSDRLCSIDNNGDVLEVFKGKYSSEQGGYSHVMDFCFNPSGDKVYFVTYRHQLLCFDMNSGSLEWHYGTIGVAGNIGDGNLYNPISIDYVGTDRLIISSWNGNTTVDGELTTKNRGHVSLFDASTGSFIKSISGCKEGPSSFPESNTTSYIHCLRIINDKLYMCHYHDNMVSIWDIDSSGNISFVKRVTKPDEVTISALYPISISSDGNGNLLVASQGQRAIGVVNESTNDLVEFFGKHDIDDQASPINNPYGFNSIRNIYYENGYCFICDYGNNRVVKVKPSTYQIINLTSNRTELEKEGMSLIYTSNEVHSENPLQLLVKTADTKEIKKITRVYRKTIS